MSDSESDCEIEKAAEAALATLVSEKSRKIYEETYRKFDSWCAEKNVGNFEENSDSEVASTSVSTCIAVKQKGNLETSNIQFSSLSNCVVNVYHNNNSILGNEFHKA